MLKREVIRILALMLLGIVLGTLLGVPLGVERLLIVPLYVVGIFYAGRTFLGMLGRLLSTYGRYQMTSLMFRSLSAALLCLVLLVLGLALVCTVGWFIGLIRCVAALVSAAQLDRSLRDSSEEWDFR